MAAALFPSVFSGGIAVVFDVAGRQDAGEIVFDVESVLGGDPGDVDTEDAPEITEGGAESPARPVSVIEAVADDDSAAIVDGLHELPARGAHGSEAAAEVAVGELMGELIPVSRLAISRNFTGPTGDASSA